MYLIRNSSQGLVHSFYREVDHTDGWDLKEISELYTLVKDYYFKLTKKITNSEEEMAQYFSNLLNIENISLLKIARFLERNQHRSNYKLTQESLVGIGAKLEEWEM